MLNAEKILITGATGKIGFPIARALAERNEVWGAARLKQPETRNKLTAAGIKPVVLDIHSSDLADLATDFTYVFHAAVDPGTGSCAHCVETNAQRSGDLLHHCRTAKGFVLCSTGSVYAYAPARSRSRRRTREFLGSISSTL